MQSVEIPKDQEVHFYYLRDMVADKGSRPFGCVCLWKVPYADLWNRGISLCSSKEKHFVKEIARNIAAGRANPQNGGFDRCRVVRRLHDKVNVMLLCRILNYLEQENYNFDADKFSFQIMREVKPHCWEVSLRFTEIEFKDLLSYEQRIVRKPEVK